MPTDQAHFSRRVAPALVGRLPGSLTETSRKSTRFSYFEDDERFVLVVPPTDKAPDWALVYGLAERRDKRLVLVLPIEGAFASVQRAPWMYEDARPEIWLYDRLDIHKSRARTTDQTIEAMTKWATKKGGVTAELEAASRPLHLGDRKAAVQHLAEWATRHAQLDAAHRQGQRSWQVAGQRVLTFASTSGGGLRITAGIQDKAGAHSKTFQLSKGDSLDSTVLDHIQQLVESAIETRLTADGPYPPDEHWLQAALRREPSLVGVESPALREVPAWRPSGVRAQFSRGYIDLLGLDGQGDIRIVEAKIAKSTDELTLLQGIDYVVWANAYKQAIRAKLSAPTKAELHLHFVVGRMDGLASLLPKRIAAYAAALDTSKGGLPFQFHVVEGWQQWRPSARPLLRSTSYPENLLPS